MTKLTLATETLTLEAEHGQFRFLAPGGWTVSQFHVARIPELIALLHVLQRQQEISEALEGEPAP